MMKRPLIETERELILRFAEKLGGEQREQLIADMTNATAESVTGDGSRVVFCISGYQRPSYKGQHSYGVEAKMLDRDGTELSVSLYADENGRLYELEVVRWGPGKLIAPDWSTLTLY